MERHLIVAIQDSSSTLYERVGGKSARFRVTRTVRTSQMPRWRAPPDGKKSRQKEIGLVLNTGMHVLIRLVGIAV